MRPIVILGILLVSVVACAGQPEDEYPMPARKAYYELKTKMDSLSEKMRTTARKGTNDRRTNSREKLQKELDALNAQYRETGKKMRKEIEELNKRIFEARQAELAKRARPEVPNGMKLGFSVLTYPRVNGSTSAHPLGVLIACRLLGAKYEWSNKYRRPSSNYGGLPISFRFENEDYLVQYRLLAKVSAPGQERLAAIINQQIAVHTGTHGAYVSLVEKKSDLILTARAPSADELELASKKGVETDVRPVALDAFVFIVNRANKVKGLSTEELKAIYAGGGETSFNAYQRNATSGSQVLMIEKFMKGTKLHTGGNEWRRRLVRSSMGGPYSALTQDVNGLAYSVYFYEHFMSASPYTRTLAVDGVRPLSDTIRSGKYPYVTEVFAVIRKDEPEDSGARRLRNWLLSDEGQAVVEESGYVPLPKRE